MKTYTDAEIWDACVEVMQSRPGPLEIRDIAANAGCSEEVVIAGLIRETGLRRQAVQFRFPPLPRAALTAIG